MQDSLNRRHTISCFGFRLLASLDLLLEDFHQISRELVFADYRHNGRFESLVHFLLFGNLTVACVQRLRPFQQLKPTTQLPAEFHSYVAVNEIIDSHFPPNSVVGLYKHFTEKNQEMGFH